MGSIVFKDLVLPPSNLYSREINCKKKKKITEKPWILQRNIMCLRFEFRCF